jgi:hypothetical protein
MEKMKKIISTIVLISFLLNTALTDLAFSQSAGYPNTDKLAAASRFDRDILGDVRAQDLSRIRFILGLHLADNKHHASGDIDFGSLVKTLNMYRDSDKQAPIRFLASEMTDLPAGWKLLTCQANHQFQGLKRYYAVLPKMMAGESLPFEVYTESEWEGNKIHELFGASGILRRKFFTPDIDAAIECNVAHQGFDRVLRWAHILAIRTISGNAIPIELRYLNMGYEHEMEEIIKKFGEYGIKIIDNENPNIPAISQRQASVLNIEDKSPIEKFLNENKVTLRDVNGNIVNMIPSAHMSNHYINILLKADEIIDLKNRNPAARDKMIERWVHEAGVACGLPILFFEDTTPVNLFDLVWRHKGDWNSAYDELTAKGIKVELAWIAERQDNYRVYKVQDLDTNIATRDFAVGEHRGTDGYGNQVVRIGGKDHSLGSADDTARAARAAGLSVDGTDAYGNAIVGGHSVDHNDTGAVKRAFERRPGKSPAAALEIIWLSKDLPPELGLNLFEKPFTLDTFKKAYIAHSDAREPYGLQPFDSLAESWKRTAVRDLAVLERAGMVRSWLGRDGFWIKRLYEVTGKVYSAMDGVLTFSDKELKLLQKTHKDLYLCDLMGDRKIVKRFSAALPAPYNDSQMSVILEAARNIKEFTDSQQPKPMSTPAARDADVKTLPPAPSIGAASKTITVTKKSLLRIVASELTESELTELHDAYKIPNAMIGRDGRSTRQTDYMDVFRRLESILTANGIRNYDYDDEDRPILKAVDIGEVSGEALNARREILKAVPAAYNTGINVCEDPNSPYDVLVDSRLYGDVKREVAEDQKGYTLGDGRVIAAGSRLNIKTINSSNITNIVEKVDAPEKTVLQVSNEIDLEGLKRELAVKFGADRANSIRIVPVNTNDLQKSKEDIAEPALRQKYRFDIYAAMLAARVITIDELANRGSDNYRALEFYIKSRFQLAEGVTADEYINAIVNNDMAKLIKGYLLYRPTEAYDVPDQHLVAEALISA